MEQGKDKSGQRAEEKPLKPKEITFIEKYVENGGNGAQAILETEGYNVNSIVAASVQANRLLKNAKVKAKIEQRKAGLQAKVEGQTEISRLSLLQEFQTNLKQARKVDQMAAANSAVTGQAKLLGYDTQPAGNTDIGTVNVIIFGGPEHIQRVESKAIESSEVVEATEAPAED